MLSLSASKGDVAVITDINKTYVLQGDSPLELDNWVELLQAASVTTVNGMSGIVTLTTSEINEGTNFYFTDQRAREAINAVGPLTLSTTTGNLALNYSAINFKLTGSDLDTIQGIGTGANPQFNNLTLSGILSVTGGAEIGDGLTVTGNVTTTGNLIVTGGVIEDTDNEDLIIRTNSTENQLVLDSGGNIGIGTSTPLASLHISGSATGGNWLGLFSQSGITPLNSTVISSLQNKAVTVQADGAAYFVGRDVTSNIEFIMGASSAGAAFAGSMTAHDFHIRTNNSTRITVKETTGYIGIGTTTPDSLLQVGNATQYLKVSSLGNTTISGNLSVGGSATIGNLTGLLWGTNGVIGTTTASTLGILETALAQGNIFVGSATGVATANSSIYVSSTGNVGIGTVGPNYKLTVAGSASFGSSNQMTVDASGNVTTSGSVSVGGKLAISNPPTGTAGADSAVAREYVESRGQNLVTNGNGLMGDNYNFSTFTFDPIETHGGGGSFSTVSNAQKNSDELIPVDPEKYYRLVVWAKSGNADGTEYNATRKQYMGITPYDADGNIMATWSFIKSSGSTDTTLAAQLNPGDTTVTLTDATGWYNGATWFSRNFVWWPYTNLKGYTYPNYTYSRNGTRLYSVFNTGNVGAWAAGGISGNVITLTAPWPGPALPVGTPIRNSNDGASHKYIAVGNLSVPNTWTRYEGYVGSVNTDGVNATNQFNYGTAYVKLLFLNNYGGTDDNRIRWSDLWFSELTSRNLEVATQWAPGVVSIDGQTFMGEKTFVSSTKFNTSLSVGTTTAVSMFQIQGASDLALLNVMASTSVTALYVSASGNVGIGTSEPGALLEINQGMSSYATAFTSPHLKLRAKTTTDNTGFVGITYDSSNAQNYGWSSGALRTTNGQSSFVWKYHSNSAEGTERMRIDQNGLVGIGTTTPVAKLEVAPAAGQQTFIARTVGQFGGIYLQDASNNSLFSVFPSDADLGGTALYMRDVSTLRVLIDTDGDSYFNGGNIGIGDTTPDYLLDVAGTAGFDGNLIMTGSAANIILGSNYLSGDGGDEGIFVSSIGYIGIGTTTPSKALSISNGFNIFDATSPHDILISGYDSSDDGVLDVYANNAVKARIHGNGSSYFIGGSVGIGDSSPAALFTVGDGDDFQIDTNGNVTTVGTMTMGPGGVTNNSGIELQANGVKKWTIYSSSSNGTLYITDGGGDSGVYMAQDATAWAANSDIRLKENLVPITEALSKVLNLTPYVYNFIGSQRREIGLIAQDVQQYFPELVDTGGTYLGLTYDRIAPILVQAIKEQNEQINLLQGQISSSTPISSTNITQQTISVSESNPNPTFNTLAVSQASNFYGTINVIGEAGFRSKVVFYEQVYFNKDSAGSAKILAGATSTIVTFEKPYQFSPFITLTPKANLNSLNYWVEQEVTSSFVIALSQPAINDIEFNWHAIAVYQEEILGCMDSTALNFNSEANTEGGNCEYPVVVEEEPTVPAVIENPVEPGVEENEGEAEGEDVELTISEESSAVDELGDTAESTEENNEEITSDLQDVIDNKDESIILEEEVVSEQPEI